MMTALVNGLIWGTIFSVAIGAIYKAAEIKEKREA